MISRKVIIAIDGPAGSGKNELAARVARALGYFNLDTGAMYRAVALLALRNGVDPADKDEVKRLAGQARIEMAEDGRTVLNGEDVSGELRRLDVTKAVSAVAGNEGVRGILVARQREMAQGRAVVAQGRDIGTCVFPDATVKIYLDAPAAVRAERRHKELLETKGSAPSVAEIQTAIEERDRLDMMRTVGPLQCTADYLRLDNTKLNAEETAEAALALIREHIDRKEAVC